MQDDLIKVVTEFNPKSKEKNVKISGFELIHKGEYVASNDIPNKESFNKNDDTGESGDNI